MSARRYGLRRRRAVRARARALRGALHGREASNDRAGRRRIFPGRRLPRPPSRPSPVLPAPHPSGPARWWGARGGGAVGGGTSTGRHRDVRRHTTARTPADLPHRRRPPRRRRLRGPHPEAAGDRAAAPPDDRPPLP
ncbi:exported hypothetical protein [Streptomyces misionensis JCM 4497]